MRNKCNHQVNSNFLVKVYLGGTEATESCITRLWKRSVVRTNVLCSPKVEITFINCIEQIQSIRTEYTFGEWFSCLYQSIQLL